MSTLSRTRPHFWAILAATLAGLAAAAPASAWEPEKPVEFVVPAGTGGGADQMARFIQGVVAKNNLMKQPIIVVNKSGGAGAEGFLDAVTQLRSPRRRDGATFWRIYRDLSDPSRYCERFIVTSWADYLHQRARTTLADQEIEARVRRFVLPNEPVTVSHYVAER